MLENKNQTKPKFTQSDCELFITRLIRSGSENNNNIQQFRTNLKSWNNVWSLLFTFLVFFFFSNRKREQEKQKSSFFVMKSYKKMAKVLATRKGNKIASISNKNIQTKKYNFTKNVRLCYTFVFASSLSNSKTISSTDIGCFNLCLCMYKSYFM